MPAKHFTLTLTDTLPVTDEACVERGAAPDDGLPPWYEIGELPDRPEYDEYECADEDEYETGS